MPSELLGGSGDQMARSAIGEGAVFASHWQEPAEGLVPSTLGTFDPKLLAKVYVFDHWIQNGDRALTEDGGNVNLLVRLSDKSLVVIDHNLAFWPNYEASELGVHACRGAWMDVNQDLLFEDEMKAALADALLTVDDIEVDLPPEWTEAKPEFIDNARSTLNRFHDQVFWDELG